MLRKSPNMYVCLHLNCLFQDYKTTAMKMSFAKIFLSNRLQKKKHIFLTMEIRVLHMGKKG